MDVFIRSLVHAYGDEVFQTASASIGVYSTLGRYLSLGSLRSFKSPAKAREELIQSLTKDELKLAARLPEKIAPFTVPMLLAASLEAFQEDHVRLYAAYFGLVDKGWLVRDTATGYLRYSHLADSAKLRKFVSGVSEAEVYDKYLIYWASELGRISEQAYQSGSNAAMQAYYCTHYPHFEAVTRLFYDPVAEAAAEAAANAAAEAEAAAAAAAASKKRSFIFRGRKDKPEEAEEQKGGDGDAAPAGGGGGDEAIRTASEKAKTVIAGHLAGRLHAFLSVNFHPAAGKTFASRVLEAVGTCVRACVLYRWWWYYYRLQTNALY
jgi:hypothetical protein